MGEEACEVVVGSGVEVVVADLRDIRHDLALVDLLARQRLAAERGGVDVAVHPCGALRALLALAGLSGLEDRG